ncbi:MAG: ABC transporter ATP-binding protein [Mucilaginibacter polytrichastri]|nr:ABC transporter ATP-binding protein [Mucilaginibacter polytrichastri]
MQIDLQNIGRRFNRDWIFRNIDHAFFTGENYAILGPNGSGKSTLLSVISGALTPSEGTIGYVVDDKPVSPEFFYRHISISAPYLELIEEFTLEEMLDFHVRFKSLLPGLDREAVFTLLNLPQAKGKQIRHFSSGMKQRLKLALALFTDASVVLLDEPCSNLDEQGIAWYRDLVARFGKERILIIGSNQAHEYDFCRHQLHITDYKPQRSAARP